MSIPTKDDVYLGDSVYLQDHGINGMVLYTFDGIAARDEIWLEPDVLIRFVKELEKKVE